MRLASIVEVQVAFCAVPISKGRKYKLLPKLRSICLLDWSVQQVSRLTHSYYTKFLIGLQDMNKAFMQGLQVGASLEPRVRGIKRKAGYKEEVVEVPNEEMKKMRIDEEAARSHSASQ